VFVTIYAFQYFLLKTKHLWAFMKPKQGVECGSWVRPLCLLPHSRYLSPSSVFFALLQGAFFRTVFFRLCRKFCSGGDEGTVVPVCGEITRPERRTVQPQ